MVQSGSSNILGMSEQGLKSVLQVEKSNRKPGSSVQALQCVMSMLSLDQG